ncbi:DEAD/DEAH box helicase [Paenibacillus koleovorans]|uniref:DEAD/DEAH box helicase n=1 Tax=Paenibacillus koleovorans TaxID=121608 RepID=UPI000FDA6201|nr:DEAD/DEAH box helicase [Paenibacillus koleovorans]
MIALERIPVDAHWLEDGRLWLLSRISAREYIAPASLITYLFGKHAASFYGLTVSVEERNRVKGLLLDPELALSYFIRPGHLLHVEVNGDPVWKDCLIAAPILLEALKKGWYRPARESALESGVDSGRIAWRLALPPDRARRLAETSNPQAIFRWFQAIMDDFLQREPQIQAAYEQLVERQPQLTVKTEGSLLEDEEEWLGTIGWKRDDCPFRASLQLLEPEVDSDSAKPLWVLRVVLLDKRDERTVIPYTPGAADGDAGLPEAWQEEAVVRISRLLRRADAVAPGLLQNGEPALLSDAQAWEFLVQISVELAEAGMTVLLPAWWEPAPSIKPKLRAKLRSLGTTAGTAMFTMDKLLEFDWRLSLGDVELSEEEFRQLVDENQRFVRRNGKWIALDPRLIEHLKLLLSRRASLSGMTFREVLELHLTGGEELVVGAPDPERQEPAEDAGAASEHIRIRMEVELNEQLERLMEELHTPSRMAPFPTPVDFNGTLRPYQQAGLSWLLHLRRFGLGACLADDMGLGKTVQWISYLLELKRLEPEAGPSLLVCPTSVLGNWEKELMRFAPSLQVYVHYGSKRAKGEVFQAEVGAADVVLTSYMTVHYDSEELGSPVWSSLCLDEAQNIKNTFTKQAAAVRELQAKHRVALTGTPIENRLAELWSLYEVLNPGYLGSLSHFRRTLAGPIERLADSSLTGRLQRLVRPFMLRRIKKDPVIQLELPEKYESKTYVSLTAEQSSLYESYLQSFFQRMEAAEGMERRGLVLAALTRLKQICNHPALLAQDREQRMQTVDPDRSGKLTRLLELVQAVRDEGERCLIFTQYTTMGEILQDVLERQLGERVPFLHGGVPKRQRDRMVDNFQNSSSPGPGGAFVLSLKAGGSGLNLTAANHIFHYDRWWNPAVENQATDRAFRIGQSRDVQVYKMIALGTLEERIDELMEKKLALTRQIAGGGESWITELSTQELRELFALRRSWIDE